MTDLINIDQDTMKVVNNAIALRDNDYLTSRNNMYFNHILVKYTEMNYPTGNQRIDYMQLFRIKLLQSGINLNKDLFFDTFVDDKHYRGNSSTAHLLKYGRIIIFYLKQYRYVVEFRNDCYFVAIYTKPVVHSTHLSNLETKLVSIRTFLVHQLDCAIDHVLAYYHQPFDIVSSLNNSKFTYSKNIHTQIINVIQKLINAGLDVNNIVAIDKTRNTLNSKPVDMLQYQRVSGKNFNTAIMLAADRTGINIYIENSKNYIVCFDRYTHDLLIPYPNNIENIIKKLYTIRNPAN